MYSRAHIAGRLGAPECSSIVGSGRPGALSQPDAHAEPNTYTQTNSDADANSHSQTNAHSNSDSETKSDANAHTDTQSHADSNARSGSWEWQNPGGLLAQLRQRDLIHSASQCAPSLRHYQRGIC